MECYEHFGSHKRLGLDLYLGAEKNFQRESSTFQFTFLALFSVLIGVSGSVYFRFVVRFCIVCGAFQHSLWCASRLVSVTFAHVD